MPPHPSDSIEPVIVRPGACFTAADDRLYALGWPHLRYLIDGHKDDGKPLANLAKLRVKYGGTWPRGVATRHVRALAELDADNSLGDPEVVKVTENAAPMTEAEARALVTRQVSGYGRGSAWNILPFVLLLEALVGAEPILDAIVSTVEAFDKIRWAPNWKKTPWDHNPGTFVLHAGLLLLRVPAKVAKRQRARLEALYKSADKAKLPRKEDTLLAGVDCALHGSAAVRRSLEPDNWRYLEWYYFVDDVEILTDRMNDSSAAQYTPSARHLWLAGPDLIPVHEKHVRKVGAAEVADYVRDIGKFRDPRLVDLMLAFVGKKSAKDAPVEWLRTHAAIARPRLKELVKSGAAKPAAAAKLALAAI